MKLSKRILIGLVLLSLTACSTLSRPLSAAPAKPDPAWTEPVPEPQLQGRDNAALAAWAKALREALAEANANLTTIRLWAEGL